MVERLSQSVERKFWKGADVEAATDVSLDPNARIPISILIHPESLPSMDGLDKDFHFLHGSVRSRWAQLGLDLEEEVGLRIAKGVSLLVGSNGKVTSPFFGEVFLHNLAARSIHIPKEAGIFRLYYDNAHSALLGKDLIYAFTSGDIKIEGEFEKDWNWAYSNEESREEDHIVGVHVRIDAKGRRWIPPDVSNIAITVDDSALDYRTEIDKFLAPVPRTSERILWIGQTNKITLSSVEAVLDRETRSRIDTSARLTRGYQINSRLIDDGRTNWPVRVEILSPTTRDTISNFVTFHFRRNLHI